LCPLAGWPGGPTVSPSDRLSTRLHPEAPGTGPPVEGDRPPGKEGEAARPAGRRFSDYRAPIDARARDGPEKWRMVRSAKWWDGRTSRREGEEGRRKGASVTTSTYVVRL